MAEVDSGKAPTLSEQYLLKDNEEKLETGTKPAEETQVKNPIDAPSEEVVSQETEETPVAAEENSKAPDAAPGESNEVIPDAGDEVSEAPLAAAEEKGSESIEEENSGGEEVVEETPVEETPEIKIETAPADFRFPTTNQTRHCFTRYVEYHRCVAAKGEGAPECDKFAKYYRSLCPGEWVDRWNEQRETGTFPGPL